MTQHRTTFRPPPRLRQWRLRLGLGALVLAASLVAIASLLLEYGFYHLPGPLSRPILHAAQVAAALVFPVVQIVRMLRAPQRWPYVLERWGEPMLLLLAGVALLLAGPADLQRWLGPEPYVVIVQAFLLGNLAILGIDLNVLAADAGIAPARLLVGGFAFLILMGTGLLMLPRAVPPTMAPLFFDDALFTATSATCVTGLIVRDTGTEFSRFGQGVILALIQLGGLGIMIFGSVFALLSPRGLTVRGAAATGEAISEEQLGVIGNMVKFIVLTTLSIELLGAVLLKSLWGGGADAVFPAVFHSVSAFCNAGFALQADSFTWARQSWQVLGIVPALVIVGGLGFPVLYDLTTTGPQALRWLWRWRWRDRRVQRPRLALHTKLALLMTVVLLVGGMAAIATVGPDAEDLLTNRIGRGRSLDAEPARRQLNDWQQLDGLGRWQQAWFQSVVARTAGFNTVDMAHLSNAEQLIMIALMFVGGSPGSTAGGLKTVTFFVLLLSVGAMLRQREQVEVMGRSLSDWIVRRAVTLAVLFAMLVGVTTLLLSITQGPTARFMDVLFESVSACATVGLSTGETARLAGWQSKLVITGAMFIGRVGPLTLLMSFAAHLRPARYSYPAEAVVIA